jgi:hypothetical protein
MEDLEGRKSLDVSPHIEALGFMPCDSVEDMVAALSSWMEIQSRH